MPDLIPLEPPFQGRVRTAAEMKGDPGREVELQEVSGILQWRYAGETEWFNLFDTSVLAGADGSIPEFRVTGTVLEYSHDGANWVALFDLGALAGADGREVQLQMSPTHIQWRYAGEAEWTNIVSLAELAGADGRSIELQKSTTHVQWRLSGDVEWIDVIALAELKGDAGPAIELQRGDTHIQWRVIGDVEWIDLISLEEIKGETPVLPENIITGEGFSSIAIVAEGNVPDPPVNGVFYFEVPPEALP